MTDLYGKKQKSTDFKVKRQNTHRCAYTVGEERCFNPGVNASTTKADDNSKWYCMGHLDALEGNNPAFGEHVLYQSRIDEPEPGWAEEMMKERLEFEPYPKQDGETSKRYGVRMINLMKKFKIKTIPAGQN